MDDVSSPADAADTFSGKENDDPTACGDGGGGGEAVLLPRPLPLRGDAAAPGRNTSAVRAAEQVVANSRNPEECSLE